MKNLPNKHSKTVLFFLSRNERIQITEHPKDYIRLNAFVMFTLNISSIKSEYMTHVNVKLYG